MAQHLPPQTGVTQILSRSFQPGVITGSRLVQTAVAVQRLVALLLIGTSTLGNFVQFNGGWERVLLFDPRGMQALLYAVAWQLFFFVWQFSMLKVRAWTWYGFALLASAVPSFMSYYALLFPWLSTEIGAVVPPGLDQVLAFALLLVAVVGNDMIPERVLVKR